MQKSSFFNSIVCAGGVGLFFVPIFLFAQTSTVLCTEGKYYCHAEGICKFAYQECKALQCTPFGPSLGDISSTCTSTYLDENTISTRCPFTGANQTVNTPPGATSVQIKIKGGSGVSPGGFSYAETDELLSAYTVVVGDSAGASGFGGGGYGGYGNGGGYSGIFYAGNPLMIAGGAGASHTGGVGGGGGLNGSDGVFAGGGSQGGGGYGGYDGIGGYAGGYLYGGYGGTDQMYTIGNNIGLAGGGGYFGGGGSINYWGSGGAGGGSGFCSSAFNFCSTCNVSQGACSNGGSIGAGGYGNLTGTSKGEVLFIWKRNKSFSADCALKNATTCNNNTICDANESCNCGDCTNGGDDDQDKCGINGDDKQLICTKSKNEPLCTAGACCPLGAEWSCAQNRCLLPCNTTQAPSELKLGVDQGYITCTGDGNSSHTHFRYRVTPLSSPAISPDSIFSQTITYVDILDLIPPRPDWTYHNNYGIPNDATTINKVCELAGFTQITSVTDVEDYYWGSPYNEYTAQWMGTSWNFAYNRPNQVMKITCHGKKNAVKFSTSTNPSFTLTKLLAKAVGGVCPTDASVYVPHLTGVVANDKLCVRLVYDNSTPGAISNALITDSVRTGFILVPNSTKNCLTPTGSPELCSDAPGMGGAIGGSGWLTDYFSFINFSLTPHAGFYGIPKNKTTGDTMGMGKKRYIYSQQCTGSGGIGGESFVYGFGNEAARAFNGCSYSAVAASIPSDILGFKNYSWISCNPQSGQEGEVLIPGFTNDSSKNYPNSVCQYTSILQNFTYSMADRYAHWLKCAPKSGQEGEEFIHGFTSSPDDTVVVGSSYPNCGLSSVAQKGTYDTLDTANGKGYIQYMIQVSSTPAHVILLPTAKLTGTVGASADSSTSTATVSSSTPDLIADVSRTFTSDIFPVGTQVLHTTPLPLGSYTVECLYGTAASVDTSVASICMKNMIVKNDDNTQGCEGMVSYKGSTLVTRLEDTDIFTARFQCINRVSAPSAQNNPFCIQYGTGPHVFLGFSTLLDPALSAGIGLNRFSAQDDYAFGLGNTPVLCAVRVGDGYSTNLSCQKTVCVGVNCSTPQTFSMIHSDNLSCTSADTSNYYIGCNPDAPQSNKDDCANWFKKAITSQAADYGEEFTVRFNFNGNNKDIKCIKYDVGGMPGGLNLYENVRCSATLDNGERYTVYAADSGGSVINSLQTTSYTVKKDTTNPDILPLELYFDIAMTQPVTDINRWYHTPVTAVVRCNDRPGTSDGSECACAKQMVSDPTLWSQGIPHGIFGPDKMYFTRTITTSTNNIVAQVRDTANNFSTQLPSFDVRIDSEAPVVSITESGSGTARTLTLNVMDNLSKLWKTTTAPAGATNNSGIIYRVGPKVQAQTLMFGDNCNTSGTYATLAETQTTSVLNTKIVSIPNINTNTSVLAYCVQDNAGNVTKGIYPAESSGCFSASNMSTIPNLDTYEGLLLPRLNNNTYGYSFSENITEANCFRTLLANNVTTLITNQFLPRTGDTALNNWDTALAPIKTSPSSMNTNGYYYYSYIGGVNNTLSIEANPTGSGTKSVVVEGGNIAINTNIDYSGTGKLLLLVARKSTNGYGGNIYINPSVTHIDALIIADGGALINSNINASGQRLLVNGRIYSYNTRGGSLMASGMDLVDASQGKKYNNSILVDATNLADAQSQDLEHFRIISADSDIQCSMHLNYQILSPSQLPPLLQRPITFGGVCGF